MPQSTNLIPSKTKIAAIFIYYAYERKKITVKTWAQIQPTTVNAQVLRRSGIYATGWQSEGCLPGIQHFLGKEGTCAISEFSC